MALQWELALSLIVAFGFLSLASSQSDDWTFVLEYHPSTDSVGYLDIGKDAFNQMFWNSEHHILKKECDDCRSDLQVIYYKRLTMLDSFDLYSNTEDWFSTNNVLGTDFNLYSTLEDALSGSNPWLFCNYDDPGVGMFRDCGPEDAEGGWQMTSRTDDRSSSIKNARFYIYQGGSLDATDSPTKEPTSSPTKTPTAKPSPEPTNDPVRDCDVLHIDEFLVDCSVEFEGHENDIDSLKSDVTTLKNDMANGEASIVALEGTVDNLVNSTSVMDAAIQELEYILSQAKAGHDALEAVVNVLVNSSSAADESIDEIKADIQTIMEQLEKIGDLPAAASVIGGNMDWYQQSAGDSMVQWNGTNMMIAGLVIANVVTMIVLAVVCCGNGSSNKHRYGAVGVASDSELVNMK